jgi:hypothetical protein
MEKGEEGENKEEQTFEDGGGLPGRRVIYTQRDASVVPMGT